MEDRDGITSSLDHGALLFGTLAFPLDLGALVRVTPASPFLLREVEEVGKSSANTTGV